MGPSEEEQSPSMRPSENRPWWRAVRRAMLIEVVTPPSCKVPAALHRRLSTPREARPCTERTVREVMPSARAAAESGGSVPYKRQYSGTRAPVVIVDLTPAREAVPPELHRSLSRKSSRKTGPKTTSTPIAITPKEVMPSMKHAVSMRNAATEAALAEERVLDSPQPSLDRASSLYREALLDARAGFFEGTSSRLEGMPPTPGLEDLPPMGLKDLPLSLSLGDVDDEAELVKLLRLDLPQEVQDGAGVALPANSTRAWWRRGIIGAVTTVVLRRGTTTAAAATATAATTTATTSTSTSTTTGPAEAKVRFESKRMKSMSTSTPRFMTPRWMARATRLTLTALVDTAVLAATTAAAGTAEAVRSAASQVSKRPRVAAEACALVGTTTFVGRYVIAPLGRKAYIVKPGDTISIIASKAGRSRRAYDKLMRMNPQLAKRKGNVNSLYVGEKLWIPNSAVDRKRRRRRR